MKKRLSKTELRKVFQHDLILLEDTREQKTHIAKYFEEKKVGVARWRLKQGDYTFLIMPNDIIGNLEPLYFGDEFLIERKSGKIGKGGGFGELRGNLVANKENKDAHARFNREFARMLQIENLYLLIENAEGVDDIFDLVKHKQPLETFKKIFDSWVKHRNEERLELSKGPISIMYSSLEGAGEAVMLLIFDYLVSKFGKIK